MVKRERQGAETGHAGHRHDGIQAFGPIVGRRAERPLPLGHQNHAAKGKRHRTGAAQERHHQQDPAIVTAIDPEHGADRREQHGDRRVGDDEADTVKAEEGRGRADSHGGKCRHNRPPVVRHAEILHGRNADGRKPRLSRASAIWQSSGSGSLVYRQNRITCATSTRMPHATVSTKPARGAVNQIANIVTARQVPDSAAASRSELKSSMSGGASRASAVAPHSRSAAALEHGFQPIFRPKLRLGFTKRRHCLSGNRTHGRREGQTGISPC